MRLRFPVVVALLGGLAVSGCFSNERVGTTTPARTPTPGDGGADPFPTPTSAASFTGMDGRVGLVKMLDGLNKPLYVTHAGDGSGRLFVVEQVGRVWVVHNGTMRATPFLDVRGRVTPGSGQGGSEQGLLSIAFHPDFKTNGFVYVDYTDRDGDTIVARYHIRSDDPDRLDDTSASTVLKVEQPQDNHNGGLVLFGRDGYLYVGLGDGGGGGDEGPGHAPGGNGQSLTTLLGKILRIDVNVDSGYRIPSNNPYGAPLKEEIWAYGLRNPWRFSFDRTTGDLWMADVGQDAWEEVNRQPASSAGGENYGWNVYEGNHHRSGIAFGHVPPVAEYAHEGGEGHCSVTGGYVYRGSAVAELRGLYVYADYCSGYVWTLRQIGSEWRSELLFDTDLLISSFGEDERGELYVTDHRGAVYRFVTP